MKSDGVRWLTTAQPNQSKIIETFVTSTIEELDGGLKFEMSEEVSVQFKSDR